MRGLLAVLVIGLAPAGTAGALAPALAEPAVLPAPVSDEQFCARAQQILVGTSRRPVNLVFTELADFIRSKPRIRPFETDQYVTQSDGGRTRPLRVSCKMKSADHLRAEFGNQAAGEERQCREVNRDTVARVYASLREDERRRLALPANRIVLVADEAARTGASFTSGTDRVWIDADGRLNLQALSIRVDWNDWLWRWMPDRFRGQHSCHFIAPEYLRALVLGEAEPPVP